jgi:ABC-type transport system substrate-binding protein
MVINITTADVEDLKLAAEEIANYWRSLGLTVNINVYSLGDINDIIKNRNFEVLLFGSIVEHDTDLFAYWHSSQRAYPGLNISDYASKNMDKNLEILKSSINTEEREKALLNIKNELEEELPAIPLYSNNLNYIYNKNIKNSSQKIIPDKIIDKSERFININNWYIYEEKIWRFSYKRNLIETLENIIH